MNSFHLFSYSLESLRDFEAILLCTTHSSPNSLCLYVLLCIHQLEHDLWACERAEADSIHGIVRQLYKQA